MKEVVSVDLMRKSDAATINSGISGVELMRRAAAGVYDSVDWQGKIAIVCGSGNNGGDGYALALILKDNGHFPHIIQLSNKLSPDGEYYFSECKNKEIHTLPHEKSDYSSYDIIVDCIFGTGFKGCPDGVYADAINKINASGAYIVSVDINSGLNGDSGMYNIAVKSDMTVSVGTMKSGLVLGMARDCIGRLVNTDIGIPVSGRPYYLIEGSDCKSVFKKRLSFSNKGDYGYVAVIGGSMEYSGAVKLSNLALSALKSGAGVSKLATAKSVFSAVSPYLVESTFYPLSDEDGRIVFIPSEADELLRGVRAVAIGMGMGISRHVYDFICYTLKNYAITVIIDADGLNCLAKFGKEILKDTECRVIITPHPKELSRLTDVSVEGILDQPIELAKAFAREYGCITLLKGSATVVTDGENVYITDTGCPGMATAGSGDVLSGIILGVCAQNNIKEDMLINTAVAAYINGRAGELASSEQGEVSMTSLDTVHKIAEAIKSAGI